MGDVMSFDETWKCLHQYSQTEDWSSLAPVVVHGRCPKTTLAPLQRVLNATARLILNLNRQDHVTLALQQLHWLPIMLRGSMQTVRYDALDTLPPVSNCLSYLASIVSSFNCRRSIHQTGTSFSSDGALLYPERWNSWRAGIVILWSCSPESTAPTCLVCCVDVANVYTTHQTLLLL